MIFYDDSESGIGSKIMNTNYRSTIKAWKWGLMESFCILADSVLTFHFVQNSLKLLYLVC